MHVTWDCNASFNRYATVAKAAPVRSSARSGCCAAAAAAPSVVARAKKLNTASDGAGTHTTGNGASDEAAGSSSSGATGRSTRSTSSLPWGRRTNTSSSNSEGSSDAGSSGGAGRTPIIQRVVPAKSSSKVKTANPGPSIPVNQWQLAAQQQQQQAKADKRSPPAPVPSQQRPRKQKEQQQAGEQQQQQQQQQQQRGAQAAFAAAHSEGGVLPLGSHASSLAAAAAMAQESRPILPLPQNRQNSLFGGLLVDPGARGKPQGQVVRSTRQRRAQRLRPPTAAPRPPPGVPAPAAAAGHVVPAAEAAAGDAGVQQQQQQYQGGHTGPALALDDVLLDDVFELDWSGVSGNASTSEDPWQQKLEQQQQQRQCELQTSGTAQPLVDDAHPTQSGVAGWQTPLSTPDELASEVLPQQPGGRQDQQKQHQHQQQQQHPPGIQPQPISGDSHLKLPPINSRTWAAAAEQLFPTLYDPGWHTSLAAFSIDLWDAVAAAHKEPGQSQLRDCYTFARACAGLGGGGGGSVSAYAQGCCFLPLAELLGAPDSEASAAGCIQELGGNTVRGLLLPLMRRTGQSDASQKMVMASLELAPAAQQATRGDGGVAGAAWLPAPGLWEGVERVMELRGVYPGTDPSILAHMAQQHGAWLD